MIVAVAFDVKNYIEVMEGWPLTQENVRFFLEREGIVLKRVCLSFSGVSAEYAPVFAPENETISSARISTNHGDYVNLARKRIMNWQAVISGLQVVDLDYDSYEIRFNAENSEEESRIHLRSIKTEYDKSLNCAHDFEQIGRAFCADLIPDDRIESTAHYREGRLAFEAGRYVDAYNNMFLFLETRYCEGKTSAKEQVKLLSKNQDVCLSIEKAAFEFFKSNQTKSKERFGLFSSDSSIEEKIRKIILLRGKLRHHILKSPDRWDPNKQDVHKGEARFLTAVVHGIVIKESLSDIYAPTSLEKFRKQSVSSGNEVKIKLKTHRASFGRALELNLSYPTTVVSTLMCVNTVREAVACCEKNGQLADTVKFEAVHGKQGLELLSVDFDVWAYTATGKLVVTKPIEFIRCDFEYFRSGLVARQEFSVPFRGITLAILEVWKLLMLSFDHIENVDPTTRIISLKLYINDGTKSFVSYRVGASVRF